MCEKLSAAGVDMIEVNISCPNVKAGGLAYGTRLELAAEVTEEAKKHAGGVPVMVKLSPNVTDITEIAMNGRLFIQPTLRMAAMIDTLLAPGPLKKSVGHIGPCRPPEDKLFPTVPAFRNRILSAVFCAFGILGNTLITLRFSR